MQFDLNYWYDEDRDGQMEFCFGQEEYGNYWKSFGKYKLINGRAQKYEDFPENISSLMPCNINNDKTIDYCGGILRGNERIILLTTKSTQTMNKVKTKILKYLNLGEHPV